MRSPARNCARLGLWAGVVLGCCAVAPASAHVLLSFPAAAFSDTPVPFVLRWGTQACGPGPFFADNVHPSVEATAVSGVFRIPWGEYPGLTCTEFNPISEETAEGTLGILPAGLYTLEVRDQNGDVLLASAQVRVYDRPPCESSESRLCLHEGRFGVAVGWRDFAGGEGVGHAVPRDPELPFLADTGFLWFFRPGNFELMVKVLDGCSLNGHFWVFISPGSTVGYTIEVTDHSTGAKRSYTNPLGAVPTLTADTQAFPCS
jgi:hypothetical protein